MLGEILDISQFLKTYGWAGLVVLVVALVPYLRRVARDWTACVDTLKSDIAELKAFQKRTKDPWILKWEYE